MNQNIETIDEKNIEPDKTKYILWRTLQAINSNITFNFELFSLLSSINLKVLKDLGSKIQDIEIEKIYELYYELEKYQDISKASEHPIISKDSLFNLDTITRAISVCEDSNKTLLKILAKPEDDSLIESYNKNVHSINVTLKILKLNTSALSLSLIKDLSSNHEIIQNSMMELLNILVYSAF